MADAAKRKKITMLGGVVGEDGSTWLAGEVHEASAPFADALIARGKAVEGEKPAAKK